MKKMKISLSSIEDVKEFVALTNSYSFDSDLVSGRYAVDAKSIMGIFSLDLQSQAGVPLFTMTAPRLTSCSTQFSSSERNFILERKHYYDYSKNQH